MYIGLAFNERNDAFDFNTALEDSRREKEVERKLALGMTASGSSSSSSMLLGNGKKVDYTMKEGEKIHVSIPKLGGGGADEKGIIVVVQKYLHTHHRRQQRGDEKPRRVHHPRRRRHRHYHGHH